MFDGSLALVWVDGSDGTGSPTAQDVMSHVTSGFSSHQLQAVVQLDNPADIPSRCPENFNLFSTCFAAVTFNSLPSSTNASANYTMNADGGLGLINVVAHTSDYELRLLPLQWAIDSVSVP